ncbi:MAG: hypothetical protein M0R38_04005 [Bacteroidia bacterium]|nr:hypothetical protein [Bacteroidia bacterium]
MKRLALIPVIFVTLIGCKQNLPSKTFKQGELLYNPTIASELVERTGNFLADEKFFTDDAKTSIVLDKNKDTLFLIIVVDKQYQTDTSYDYTFRNLANKASIEIFNNQPVYAEIADRNLVISRRIK